MSRTAHYQLLPLLIGLGCCVCICIVVSVCVTCTLSILCFYFLPCLRTTDVNYLILQTLAYLHLVFYTYVPECALLILNKEKKHI